MADLRRKWSTIPKARQAPAAREIRSVTHWSMPTVDVMTIDSNLIL